MRSLRYNILTHNKQRSLDNTYLLLPSVTILTILFLNGPISDLAVIPVYFFRDSAEAAFLARSRARGGDGRCVSEPREERQGTDGSRCVVLRCFLKGNDTLCI